MLNVVKWLFVTIGGLVIIYAILIFAGVLISPVYMPYYTFPIIILLVGIGIVLLALGFAPSKKDS